MKYIQSVLYIILLLLPLTGESLELELAKSQFHPDQISKIQDYINQTAQYLPKSLQTRLSKKITIKFENISSLGRTQVNSPTIILSNQLLDAIYSGPNRPTKLIKSKIATKHKNDYQIAMGTLLHEIAHQYDFYHTERPFNAEDYEKKICRELRQEADHSSAFNGDKKIDIPASCTWRSYQLNASDNPQFAYAIGWQKKEINNGLIEKVDDQIRRSPYPNEFSSLAEAFAINFEFYLLDPEYKCRRPTAFKFLSMHFNETPSNSANCENGNHVLVLYNSLSGMGSVYEKIDMNQVYQVHYLLANEGASTMSSWGHSMLRLVICAPFRTAVGPECLKDLAYHKVISYRAGVTDIAINPIKGITGQYPSQLFVLPFLNVVNEYTRGEFRDLLSYPLNLNSVEIEDFVTRVIEQFWSYRGKYYFISNNCAVETLNILKHIKVNNYGFASENPSTPRGVLNLLLKTGYAKDLSTAQVQSGYYYWPSKQAEFQKHLLKVNNIAGTNIKDFNSFIEQSADEDLRVLNSLIQKNQGLASFLILESQKYDIMMLKKNYAILKSLSEKSDSPLIQTWKNEISNVMTGGSSSLKDSYGIPSNKEIQQLISQRENQLKAKSEDTNAIRMDLGAEFSAELNSIGKLIIEANKLLIDRNITM